MNDRAIAVEPRRPVVAERQSRIYGEGPAIRRALERWMPFLERAARQLSRGDPQLAKDMVQEARVELWDRDVARYDEADEKALRKVLYDRMRWVRREERKAKGGERRVKRDVDAVAVDEDGDVIPAIRLVRDRAAMEPSEFEGE